MSRRIDTSKLPADIRKRISKARDRARGVTQNHDGSPASLSAVENIDDRFAALDADEREISEKAKRVQRLKAKSRTRDREI